MLESVDHKVDADASTRWMVRLRRPAESRPTFVFFPHAGGSPLSAGRLVNALPSTVGIMVANLPRGGDIDDACPPNRVAAATKGLIDGFLALGQNRGGDAPGRLVLIGNSYGALLAYEMAWRMAHLKIPVERLVVSGFRSPVLPCSETSLYRLPRRQLRAELAARFGIAPGDGAEWAGAAVEEALRADLEACDTYRHAHTDRLAVPIDVLHMRADPSVTLDELSAWRMVTSACTRVDSHALGHFPWTTHPDTVARVLLQLIENGCRDQTASTSPETTTPHNERG